MKKINKICPVCDKSYSVPFCHRDRYHTCGRKCGGIYRLKPIIENKCKQCGIKFVSKRHPKRPQDFCNRKCSSESRSVLIDRVCVHCKAKFKIIPSRIVENKNRGQFCSNKCKLEKWNIDSLKSQRPGQYRKTAWKLFEKKCYDCGNKDFRVLVIHHIDGCRANGLVSNLIPVCHNCHCIRHIKLSGNARMPSYRGGF